MRVTRAYVGLGANLGDREATLRAAVDALAATPGVEVVAVSALVETEPVGHLDQPRFLNGVAVLETDLAAASLLGLLLAVEARFGRDRAAVPAQGPRTLDLDLLLYGDAEIDEEGLRIPAPAPARAAPSSSSPSGGRARPGGARNGLCGGHPGPATLTGL